MEKFQLTHSAKATLEKIEIVSKVARYIVLFKNGDFREDLVDDLENLLGIKKGRK